MKQESPPFREERFKDFECCPSTETLNVLAPDTATPKKKWNCVTDPIVPFLKHSDSGGYIGPKQCETMLKRAKKLLTMWPRKDKEDRACMLQIIELMAYAANNRRRLMFSWNVVVKMRTT